MTSMESAGSAARMEARTFWRVVRWGSQMAARYSSMVDGFLVLGADARPAGDLDFRMREIVAEPGQEVHR